MVYLLHFSEPYHHARHFIGAAANLDRVLELIYEPTRYSNSPLLIAAAEAGIKFQIADILPGDRRAASRLRARKATSAICSVCRDIKRGERVV